MAAHEREFRSSPIAHLAFNEQLAAILPEGFAFKIYHVSTPPTLTAAIYSAPPREQPDRTYCESHFLTIAINATSKDAEPQEVLIFAVEILIFWTFHSTTIFVSKADSSGYLHLLNLPKGASSPLKDISSTFLSYLVKSRRRPGIRTIVSLFARAQDQYLFPRSVLNQGKHVLDDRGLVKWWCRILDPLVQAPDKQTWESSKGFLVVPGLDNNESKAFLPKAIPVGSWTIGHPLRLISRYPGDVPPRCLIPHFPDDPKARFLDVLDEELSESQGHRNGQWKSVQSLEAFWEMMAFRQECSAGRLVGFLWVVLTPILSPSTDVVVNSQTSLTSALSDFADDFDTPQNVLHEHETILSPTTSFSEAGSPIKRRDNTATTISARSIPYKKLTGPIFSRKPQVKTHNRKLSVEKPERTAYYFWPADSRGQVVIDEKEYKRIDELLLCLDFENVEKAQEGTRRWTEEVRSGSLIHAGKWGMWVNGTKAFQASNGTEKAGVNVLNMGVVRKKRKVPEGEVNSTTSQATVLNILGAGILRKKAKT